LDLSLHRPIESRRSFKEFDLEGCVSVSQWRGGDGHVFVCVCVMVIAVEEIVQGVWFCCWLMDGGCCGESHLARPYIFGCFSMDGVGPSAVHT